MSKIKRRSGIAVTQFAALMGWSPTLVVQVGVGSVADEIWEMLERWPECKFLGFEPHPKIFRQWEGKYPGTIHSVALGARSGMRKLYCKPRHLNGSTLIPYDDREMPSVGVEVRTLDDFLPEIQGHRVLLWLDCEGFEDEVLKGGGGVLEECVEMANVEQTSLPPGKRWASPVDIYRQMREAGFYWMWQHTNRMVKAQCDVIYVHHDLFRESLCSCPGEIERFRDSR